MDRPVVELASHAVVFRGLVLPPPLKRLLTQAPHSFPIVLLPKHPSQSPSRHCPMISNRIPGYNGRFRFSRALYSLWYSLERFFFFFFFFFFLICKTQKLLTLLTIQISYTTNLTITLLSRYNLHYLHYNTYST